MVDLHDVEFINNDSAERGSWLSVITPIGSQVYIDNCTFKQNHSKIAGSAIYFSVSNKATAENDTLNFLRIDLNIKNTKFSEHTGNYVISIDSTGL